MSAIGCGCCRKPDEEPAEYTLVTCGRTLDDEPAASDARKIFSDSQPDLRSAQLRQAFGMGNVFEAPGSEHVASLASIREDESDEEYEELGPNQAFSMGHVPSAPGSEPPRGNPQESELPTMAWDDWVNTPELVLREEAQIVLEEGDGSAVITV